MEPGTNRLLDEMKADSGTTCRKCRRIHGQFGDFSRIQGQLGECSKIQGQLGECSKIQGQLGGNVGGFRDNLKEM
jgi:hypothetical protein